MTTPRLHTLPIRSALAIILGFFIILANIGGIGGAVQSASAASLGAVPSQGVAVPAGGSASIQVRGFALQPGATLPQGPLALAQVPLASDRVRTSLFYGIDWGYTDTEPQQVALALWYAQDGTWHATDHAIADRIANAAAGSPGTPFWNTEGRSLVALASQGQVTLSPLTLSGDSGTLAVRNTGSQDLTVYLPYGTLFTGADGTAIVWATGGGQVNGATPTAQPAATNTPAPAATNTPVPSPTDFVKPGATPPWEQPTSTPIAVQGVPSETPTVQASDPSPTATATQAAIEPPSIDPTQTATPSATAVPFIKPASDTATATPVVQPAFQKPVATATATASRPEVLAANPPSNDAVHAMAGQPSQPGTQPAARDAAAPAPPPQTAPSPVGTQGQAPPPVGTGAAQATPPNPELTQAAPLPTKQAPTSPTFTPLVKATPTPAPTQAQPGASDTGGGPAAATPAPATPAPQPTPLPPTAPGEKEPPTIIVAPDNGGKPAPPVQDTKPPATSGTGPKPTTNPVTGAGASSLPAWLGLLSALLVIGGWALRKMSDSALRRQAVEVEIAKDPRD